MLYIYQNKDFQLTVDQSWMELFCSCFSYLKITAAEVSREIFLFIFTGNVLNLFVCFGKFWFQRQTVNMMKEVLMVGIQSWEGWWGGWSFQEGSSQPKSGTENTHTPLQRLCEALEPSSPL